MTPRGPRVPPSQQSGASDAARMERLRALAQRYKLRERALAESPETRERRQQADRVAAQRVELYNAYRNAGKAEATFAHPPSAQQRYVAHVRRWARSEGIRYQAAQRNGTFKYWYGRLMEIENQVARGQLVDRSPTGAYARALVELRFRDANDWRNVGETPKVRGR